MTLDNYIQDLRSKSDKFSPWMDKYFEKRGGNLILRKVKLRLFNRGIDGDGKKLINKTSGRSEYTEKYKRYKRRKGARANPVNLRLTGAWYGSMTVRSRFSFGKGIQIQTPGKEALTEELKEDYGNAILLLTLEEEQKIIEEIEPDIVNWFFNKNIDITLK